MVGLRDPVTLVIYRPVDPKERESVAALLLQLEPYTTSMALFDEMSVLDAIENHEDMPEHVLSEARELASKMPPPTETFGSLKAHRAMHGGTHG